MKKVFFQIIILLLLVSLNVAKSTDVSISVGAQYADQVWYSIPNNAENSAPLASWDIAFYSYDQNASIRINSGAGAKVWEILGKTIDDFDTNIDTTGLTTNPERFVEWYNSDTSWTIGAFNRGRDGFENEGDFGWGAYNMNTHAIVGDKLFIYRSIEGVYYVFTIQDLIGGTFTFKYKILNSSQVITREFSKSLATSKLFGYYLFSSDEIVDIEPLQSDWDLLFTKYIAMIPDNNGSLVPYSVMGVLSNKGNEVAKVENVPIDQAQIPDNSSFSTNISTIGHTWKAYDAHTGWSIVPDLTYFVRAQDQELYRIIFKSFGGSANGNIVFDNSWQEVGVNESFAAGDSFIITPNIIEGNSPFEIVLDANALSSNAIMDVYSITGVKVLTRSLNITDGLNAFSISHNLAKGMYIVTLNLNGNIEAQKLIIE
ncbi:MAG: T9SS type A sorting domain-containing protein [Methanobacterium sp.]